MQWKKSRIDGIWSDGMKAFNPLLDKTDLMTLWIIESICETHGKCKSTNSYLARHIGRSESKISKSITKLEDLLYIECRYYKKKLKTI